MIEVDCSGEQALKWLTNLGADPGSLEAEDDSLVPTSARRGGAPLSRRKRANATEELNASTGLELLVSAEEAASRLSLGRTTVYALIASGRLRSVRIGRLRRVPIVALNEFVERIATQERER